MSSLQNLVALLARLVLSPLFIFGGVNPLVSERFGKTHV